MSINIIKLEKIVKLEKKIDHKTLEDALIKAAEEIGWKTEVEYVSKETTRIKLKGRLLPAMWVLIRYKSPIDMNKDIHEYLKDMSKPREDMFYDTFYTVKEGPIGFVSQKKFKQYLDAVYRNLFNKEEAP